MYAVKLMSKSVVHSHEYLIPLRGPGVGIHEAPHISNSPLVHLHTSGANAVEYIPSGIVVIVQGGHHV